MNRIRALMSSFDRLSTREKGLIVGMVLLFCAVILFFVFLWVSSTIGSLEEEVREGRESLEEIRTLADKYQGTMRRQKATQQLINENSISSLRIPVNTIAKRITAESDKDGFAGQGKRLSDLISYGGKTVETRIETKKKSRKRTRKEQDEGGNFEIEQTMEFSEIPLKALYQFLQEIARTEDLIFTRRLEIQRRFNNTAHVRATLSVSTIKYREAEGM